MTAAPVRRMSPAETVHRSQRGGGRWRPFALAAGVFVLAASLGVVWVAWLDGQGIGRDEPPPLIRADPRPYKLPPDDPGGRDVANADSNVVDLLTGRAEPRPQVEQLLPRAAMPSLVAPPPPEPKAAIGTPDGGVLAELTPVPPPPSVTAVEPPPPPEAAAPAAAASPPAVTATPVTPPVATAAARTGPATPAAPPAATPPAAARQATTPPAAVAARTPAATAAPARSAPAAGPIFRLQLGAFRSEGAAGQAWIAFQNQHQALLGRLRANIVRADTSDGSFFRLQAGPLPDRAAAADACARIKRGGGDCFIVGPLP